MPAMVFAAEPPLVSIRSGRESVSESARSVSISDIEPFVIPCSARY